MRITEYKLYYIIQSLTFQGVHIIRSMIWTIWYGVYDIINFAKITFSRELFHQSDEVMNKMAQSTLNNCLVLQRNFEACVTAAKSNQGSLL